jgi:hypothetical protein
VEDILIECPDVRTPAHGRRMRPADRPFVIKPSSGTGLSLVTALMTTRWYISMLTTVRG